MTKVSNFLNNQNLTDAHTCYKVMETKVFKKIILNEKKIFLTLRRMKPIRRGKKPNKIFDSFLKKFSNNENKKLINKTVSIFQRYQCKELKKTT